MKIIEGGRKQLEYETLNAIFSTDRNLLDRNSKKLDALNSHKANLTEINQRSSGQEILPPKV